MWPWEKANDLYRGHEPPGGANMPISRITTLASARFSHESARIKPTAFYWATCHMAVKVTLMADTTAKLWYYCFQNKVDTGQAGWMR